MQRKCTNMEKLKTGIDMQLKHFYGFLCNAIRSKIEIKCMILNLMDLDAIKVFLGFFMQCNMAK